MRAPDFWWTRPGAAAAMLRPAAAIYGAVAAHRLIRPGARAGVPVLCVGDPTVGGAGKTPTAIAAAALLARMGESPVFLTRGYGGTLRGPVRVDPAVHRAQESGDEPLLLAAAAPTIVSRDRVAGAVAAVAEGASAIVMDDGFQNPALAKDCALLVVDAARGAGNGAVFPAGPLRAPLDAQLARAHALMIVGDGDAAAPIETAARRRGMAILHGRLVPDAGAIERLRAAPVLAFAGIGHPQKFFSTLTAAGIALKATKVFADHHPFSESDARELIEQANQVGALLATTEKDAVRLRGAGGAARAQLAERTTALPVTLSVDDEENFARLLRERLRPRA